MVCKIKNSLTCLLAFFLAFSTTASCYTANISNSSIVYGAEAVKGYGNGMYTISLTDKGPLNHTAGARVEFDAMKAGKYCLDLKVEAVNGTIFAMYLTSGEPANYTERLKGQWDELDFEFLGRNPDKVWVNAFHDQTGSGMLGYYVDLDFKFDSGFNLYCIEFDIVEKHSAVWTVNGRQVQYLELTDWVRPLMPVLSFWALPSSSDIESWAGKYQLNGTMYAYLKSITIVPEHDEEIIVV